MRGLSSPRRLQLNFNPVRHNDERYISEARGGCRALSGDVTLALQEKTPETREQSKDFMLLLRELDPPVNARSRWTKVGIAKRTACLILLKNFLNFLIFAPPAVV